VQNVLLPYLKIFAKIRKQMRMVKSQNTNYKKQKKQNPNYAVSRASFSRRLGVMPMRETRAGYRKKL
jgi:hypothetical protein